MVPITPEPKWKGSHLFFSNSRKKNKTKSTHTEFSITKTLQKIHSWFILPIPHTRMQLHTPEASCRHSGEQRTETHTLVHIGCPHILSKTSRDITAVTEKTNTPGSKQQAQRDGGEGKHMMKAHRVFFFLSR